MKRAILLFVLISAPAGAKTFTSGTGLETANYKYVALTVEDLPADAGSIGLTENGIQTHVELRLKSAGLTPGNDPSKNETSLYVRVNVTGDAYGVFVEYKRLVGFTTGNQQYRYVATTWDSGSTGIGDAVFIVNALDGHLDRFLNEYLKVNRK